MKLPVRFGQWAGHIACMIILVVLAFWITTQLRPLNEWMTTVPYGDASILAYILGWGAHSLITNPLDYYNIPIGYPKSLVLAGMDGMIFQAILAMPAWFLTHNIPLVYYSTIFASMIFSSIAAYWSCHLLLKSRIVSLTIAIVFTVTTDRFFHSIGHLNLIFTGFIPLAFSFTYYTLSQEKKRWVVYAALATGLSIFASNYTFVLSVMSAGFAVLCYFTVNGYKAVLKRLKWVIGIFVLAGITGAPIAAIHLYGKGETSTNRTSLAMAEQFDASIAGWFMPPNRPGTDISRYAKPLELPEETSNRAENCQFIGVAVIFLLLLEGLRLGYKSINHKWEKIDTLSTCLIVSGSFLFLSSFGPRIQVGSFNLPGPYMILHKLYFQFTGFFRVPSRLAFITEWMFGLAIGIGIIQYLAKYPGVRVAAALIIISVTLFEHVPAGVQNGYFVGTSKMVTELDKADPSGKEALIILPDPRSLGPVVYSTMSNWRPVANAWPDNPLLTDYTRFFIAMNDINTTRSVASAISKNIKWVITQNSELFEKAKSSFFLEQVAEADGQGLFKFVHLQELKSQMQNDISARQDFVNRLRSDNKDILELTVSNGLLKPAYGLGTEVQAAGSRLILVPGQAQFGSFNISLPQGFIPALWDELKVDYTTKTPVVHDVHLYWISPQIPLSERTHMAGSFKSYGNDYTATINLSTYPDWLWQDSISAMRVDFNSGPSPDIAPIFIKSVTFLRSDKSPTISF